VGFENKNEWIVLDQIRTSDATRLVKKIGKIYKETIHAIKNVIKEMLVD